MFVDGKKEEKAKTKVEEMASIEIQGNTLRYVSRGGLKLEKAVEEFRLDLSNKACMDVGASTGGNFIGKLKNMLNAKIKIKEVI